MAKLHLLGWLVAPKSETKRRPKLQILTHSHTYILQFDVFPANHIFNFFLIFVVLALLQSRDILGRYGRQGSFPQPFIVLLRKGDSGIYPHLKCLLLHLLLDDGVVTP